ncbi:cobalt ECF transporter T component CbiQ [Roseospira marina]|uniref:Cobalt ECF transporter T component CbiQ n=1 Tax=Roseospira marina TaxID=140057 RepID=A0A5M6ID00_9PROT|nr:cobalt ECF transporter T component CbiQ [Roseospira marina]KAA5605615.1 cobalt ECF transporter T component CbiQ [Roseospira marina]MBB4313315.1 cobalt/nickel transport system permease protein [Roseospira marina]MBB5085944.1 cobalt/nickel transport system permease protein [Roseospira marina]
MSHVLGQRTATPDTPGRAVGEAPRPDPIQALDPRTRILAAAAFAVVTVSLSDLVLLTVSLLLAVVAMLTARLAPGPTLKRMVMMDGFIFVLLLMLPFTVPGPVAFTVLGWPASWPGLEKAAAIALKANAIVLMLLSLVGSMDPTTLGHALARLKAPMALVHLLLFTVRYIGVIDDEYHRMRRAMKARGFRPRTNGHTLRSVGYLIGMLLVRALERSERILQAMKCRGFTGHLPLLDTLRFGARDAVFAVLLAGVLTGLLVLDLSHVALL